jgi:hypothetical protein
MTSQLLWQGGSPSASLLEAANHAPLSTRTYCAACCTAPVAERRCRARGDPAERAAQGAFFTGERSNTAEPFRPRWQITRRRSKCVGSRSSAVWTLGWIAR